MVEDARVQDGAGQEVRDGVGIDRASGTAAAGIKFDRAVLLAGSRLALELRVELAGDSAAGPMVAEVVRALEAGTVRLGAARTRGLGHVALVERLVRLERLDSRDGLVAALRGRLAPDAAPAAGLDDLFGVALPEPVPEDLLEVTIGWRPRGPVMVRASLDGMGVDSLPLTTVGPAGVSPLLPGSSLKGILRSRAEWIVRTALDLPVPEDRDQQLDLPLVRWLFGTSPGAEPDPDDSEPGPLPGRGAVDVQDCLGTSVDPAAWAEVVAAESLEEARAALTRAGIDRWEPSPHVAIDRWTGGVVTGRLFSVLEPWRLEWEPLRIAVDRSRLPDGERSAGMALLCLVLDDLVAGRVPIGFGVNRGFGDVEVTGVEFAPGDTWRPGDGQFLAWLPDRTAMKEAWTAWLRANG